MLLRMVVRKLLSRASARAHPLLVADRKGDVCTADRTMPMNWPDKNGYAGMNKDTQKALTLRAVVKLDILVDCPKYISELPTAERQDTTSETYITLSFCHYLPFYTSPEAKNAPPPTGSSSASLMWCSAICTKLQPNTTYTASMTLP